MEKWQFNILFFVGVGGALFLLIAPAINGFESVPKNPSAVAGIGTILTYVLTQRKSILKTPPEEKKPDEEKDGVP